MLIGGCDVFVRCLHLREWTEARKIAIALPVENVENSLSVADKFFVIKGLSVLKILLYSG